MRSWYFVSSSPCIHNLLKNQNPATNLLSLTLMFHQYWNSCQKHMFVFWSFVQNCWKYYQNIHQIFVNWLNECCPSCKLLFKLFHEPFTEINLKFHSLNISIFLVHQVKGALSRYLICGWWIQCWQILTKQMTNKGSVL